MIERQAKNSIKCISNSMGNKVEDLELIKQVIVDFFKDLLGSSLSQGRDLDTRLSELSPLQLTASSKELLQKEDTKIEIRQSMFSMGNEKAPGPDGFTTYFFKKAWAIVKEDIIKAVKSFFSARKLLGEVNSTIIALVPKVVNPSNIAEYRPITCSMFYINISLRH